MKPASSPSLTALKTLMFIKETNRGMNTMSNDARAIVEKVLTSKGLL